MGKKAVCLISGGLDSCVTSFIAKDSNYKIYGLSFYYGQKHSKELDCAKEIVKVLQPEGHIMFNIDLSIFTGSSLLDKELSPISSQDVNNIGKKIPSTYVPARNTIFLSIALAYAEVLNADSIFIGVTSTDYSGYPDCRPEYIKSFQKMANLATKRSIEGKRFQIITPLINNTKSEIIQKGNLLKIPFEKTWSCYKGEKLACGLCESCLLRLKGFKNADLRDPILYKEYPNWYKT